MANDWNDKIIAEFRANGGKVGGQFEGAPMVLVHHHGRKSGSEYVAPMMYQAADDPATIYVFASYAGAPKHPDWYFNLVSDQSASVEVGTEAYPVTVTELTGADRDATYAKQVSRYPGFGEYEEKVKGIRTIPVLALTRA